MVLPPTTVPGLILERSCVIRLGGPRRRHHPKYNKTPVKLSNPAGEQEKCEIRGQGWNIHYILLKSEGDRFS